MKLDYQKQNGLIPTIIQDTSGRVISLVYSNKESIAKTLDTRKVWLFSRSRNGVFQKGATSGNVQELISIKKDCDNDTLLYIINQVGSGGCHQGTYSCFGGKKDFSLQDLYEKISQRIKNKDENSYTKKLVNDPLLLKRKLVEEAAEVITAKDQENLVWECSDLIYFLFVTMASNGISIEDIEKENEKRNKDVIK
ncbi:MAG: bifunctional phosphoribosyl-AMP cyclohydrolase/phosphoribosyl-ATP diphosphatase HisIE [archaeon]|jgi:phosphoribosyl-ATP pyrophosphohydrolase